MLADGVSNLTGRALPDIDNLLVLFLVGEQASAIIPQDIFLIRKRLGNDIRLFGRDSNIRDSYGCPGAGGIRKADILYIVSHNSGDILTTDFEYLSDEGLNAAFVQTVVDKLDFGR